MSNSRFAVAAWVFAVLLLSYSFFWHSRDWNSASRLMLTYALADRGTVSISGLEDQTGDRARYRGKFYSDKLPGFSFLAVPPTIVAKSAFAIPNHPRNKKGFAYWPTDYWATLGTSSLASALVGALLTLVAFELGCGPRRASLVGLAYGLATPAYVYATMSYGHQAAALALFASFFLVWRAHLQTRPSLSVALAGFLAATAAVIELQVGLVSAILGTYLAGLVVARRLPARSILAFLLGAVGPTLALLAYNTIAFDSPWDMGYFHEDMSEFRNVHSAENPLGLSRINWEHLVPLFWGGYRGLLFYAPILILAPIGWFALIRKRSWDVAIVSLAACVAVLFVNLSYPEWTGGWSTGPRLLVPLIPFAMIAVAAALANAGKTITLSAVILALAGGVLILLFQGAGGRVPHEIADPLRQFVLPVWTGQPLPPAHVGERFTRTLVLLRYPEFVLALPTHRQWLQFVPLVAIQGLLIAILMLTSPRAPSVKPSPPTLPSE
jgi:hypothetical protein